jgi:SAM-dependent methyltransferase
MDFARLITPTDPAFLDLVREIHAERTDLQAAYPDPLGLGMRKWMGANGVLEYRERVGRFYPPLPPEHLRHTACGGTSEQSHLYTSIEDLQIVVELWETFSERSIGALSSVYDFGCGCGRLVRWFPLALERVRCFGSDVRVASVDWCRENLEGRFFANRVQPPLELESDSIELTVSLSIFSHLNRASNLAWIRELARVTRRDGLILLTTHGSFTLALTARSPEHQKSLSMSADEARAYLRSLERERFLFHRSPAELVAKLDGVEPDYGQAFFTQNFVGEEWREWVELVGYVPVALNLIQDFFVLRPKKR